MHISGPWLRITDSVTGSGEGLLFLLSERVCSTESVQKCQTTTVKECLTESLRECSVENIC